jgi:hypothetical protein
MDAKEVPARANLEQYKKQAKDLVKVFKVFRFASPAIVKRFNESRSIIGVSLNCQIPKSQAQGLLWPMPNW